MDLGVGGVLSGPTEETEMFQRWFKKQKRLGTQGQAPPNLSRPPARRQCSSCSAPHECLGGENYRCVADIAGFADTRHLEGCCELDTYSTSWGRRLLSNSSTMPDQSASTAGAFLSDFGCACNCTYVSQACCGAPDGVVSEPASLKKGVLAPRNSTTCCDLGTGLFQEGTTKANSTFC